MALFPEPGQAKRSSANWSAVFFLACLMAGTILLSARGTAMGGENLSVLRSRITELSKEVRASELKALALEKQETRLTEEIKNLKLKSRGSADLFLSLRIEKALNALRVVLSSIEKEENRQVSLQNQWNAAKLGFKQGVEGAIRDLIGKAETAFKAGDEETSERNYKEALLWMGQLETMKEDPVAVSPPLASRSKLILDGKESLEKLLELADLGRNDIDLFKKEIGRLEEMRKQYRQEIQLRKQLILTPRRHEREGAEISGQKTTLGKEIGRMEDNIKRTDLLLLRYRKTFLKLETEVDEIERQIRIKEKNERKSNDG